MFGLGFGEILVIMVVALIVLGPDQLPKAARTMGKALGEFRRAVDDIKSDLRLTDLDLPQKPPPRQPLIPATAEQIPVSGNSNEKPPLPADCLPPQETKDA